MDKEFVAIKVDDRYEISKDGTIRNIVTGRLIKSKRIQRDGYYHVMLGGYKCQKSYMTHKLLAEAFIPNPNKYKYVRFKDHCKTNIDLDNLEWTNNPHYIGECKKQRHVRCLTDGKEYRSISAACKAYGICDLTVKHSCTTGKSVSGGLVFEWIESSSDK